MQLQLDFKFYVSNDLGLLLNIENGVKQVESNIESGHEVPVPAGHHETALQALQAEIEFHRKTDAHKTYVEKVFSLIYDPSEKALHNVELLYKNESEKPNVLNRELIISAIKSDQASVNDEAFTSHVASNILKFSAFLGRGKLGLVGTIATCALDSMHADDSIGVQALSGLTGAGLGLTMRSIMGRYASGPLSLKSLAIPAIGVPVTSLISRNSFFSSNPKAPDAEMIDSLLSNTKPPEVAPSELAPKVTPPTIAPLDMPKADFSMVGKLQQIPTGWEKLDLPDRTGNDKR